ncbi:diaminopropionate ammonia-lyase [Klebsiella aerogenes]|uniref:diaminopropionate ammonia-lyase n=1 Tax=Klebsiella aerogenes TaxID=548 RepID=UPI001C228EDB|nr:diaminopropionate ammonia-lyase [Klebsiella aerogenes]QXA74098.1 diaminopropionate ammonia-lyase [Klebsiella aerogenes]
MFRININQFYTGKSSSLFTTEIAEEARRFHAQIPGYAETPLISLNALASRLGVKAIYVKDESKRFGLNAFKVLGGSYALGKFLADKLGVDISAIDFRTVAHQLPSPLTFTTATAGNHGTGVAWAAREMGQKAVVFMPEGSAQASVDRIKGLGAECIVTDCNYDDTVRLASATADDKGWTLVQDTAWEGYEEIPAWISQGYTTMAAEAATQLQSQGVEAPSHIMLQAGVGAMAGGVLGYFADLYGAERFCSVISEPAAADCLYRSITSVQGERVAVGGVLNSIMAGLACGEVNPVTWNILRDCGAAFASVSDDVSATGMRLLGNPLSGDRQIISGESGAINAGLLYLLATSSGEDARVMKEHLGINEDAVILIFSTEGDTNAERYRKIVWEGAWPVES